MSSFVQTVNPTPFGIFDSDSVFQSEADKMVVFVKRTLGDDILQVELTKKQIWAMFERSLLEYGSIINEYTLKSELANLLGQSTGSNATNTFPRRTLDFMLRQAEAYSTEANVGGSYGSLLGYFDLETGKQDYNFYTELKDTSGSLVFNNLPVEKKTKLRIVEVFHFSPQAAQHFLLNASNLTNFLATEMHYESYVNSTIFYVLPVFEDVLRRGMLETAYRVRRSNYTYSIYGPSIRIFPMPTSSSQDTPSANRLWVRYRTRENPLNPDYSDSSLSGSISNPSNVPFTDIQYNLINSQGRQWIREYCLALCTELVGRVRSKIKTIPIPGQDLQLNGEELIAQAREDKEKLITRLRELIDSLTFNKLIELEAQKAENLNKQLKFIPIPAGKSIIIG